MPVTILKVSFLLMSLFSFPILYAQTEGKKLTYSYPQKLTPEGIDNYLFSTYYYNGKKGFRSNKDGTLLIYTRKKEMIDFYSLK